MKFKFWEKRAEKVNPIHPKDPGIARLFNLGDDSINVDTAMTITAVYAAVTIISETIASLPLFLYKKLPNSGREKAIRDPRYQLLHETPNRYQTKFEFIECMMMALLLHGRGVAQIISNKNGVITDLLPIHPDRVTAFKSPKGTIAYEVQMQNEKMVLLDSEVIDIRGPSMDGINCLSPIQQNAATLLLARNADKYSSDFFGNATVLSGVLEVPNKLSDQAYERMKLWWERTKATGARHASPILEEGLQWKPITIKPEDSQLIETRKFSVTDIARIFRIPAYKLGDLERATFSNIEQQAIDFVTDTILSRLSRIEFAFRRSLLSENEKVLFDIGFNLDALLRGDSTSRSNFYRTMFTMGVYSPNEIRAKENENPVDGGDVRLVQLNLTTLDNVGKTDNEQT